MSYAPASLVERAEEIGYSIAHRASEASTTSLDEVLERILAIAADILDVPVTLLSLADGTRRWVKARRNTPLSQISHDNCFHAITVEQPALLLVEDASRDQRFADNPLVCGDTHVRFYLGIPIRSASGTLVGTLCCIDGQPRTIPSKDVSTVTELAALIAREFTVREGLQQTLKLFERMQKNYELSESTFRSVFELANIGIAKVTLDGHFAETNVGLSEIVGYSQTELASLRFQDITHPEDLEADLAHLERLFEQKEKRYQMRKRYRHKLGHEVWANLYVSAHRGSSGVDFFVSIIENIDSQMRAQMELAAFQDNLEAGIAERTRELQNANRELHIAIQRQLRAERALRAREAELSNVIEYANDAYISIDIDGVVRAWNRKSEEIFHWTAEEALGQYLDNLIIPTQYRGVHRAGLSHLAGTGSSRVLRQRLELPAVRKDGSTLMVEVRVHAIESDGQCFFSAFLHDITERKLEERRREHDLRHDYLTGLPNRRAFHEALSATLARRRGNHSCIALLFVDLDGFKSVNDNFGHEMGDTLLQKVGELMRHSLPARDQVFRLAGDEFTVLIDSPDCSVSSIYEKAEKIRFVLATPINLPSASVTIGASIGVAIDFDGTTDERELLRKADACMYNAKQAGRGVIFPSQANLAKNQGSTF